QPVHDAPAGAPAGLESIGFHVLPARAVVGAGSRSDVRLTRHSSRPEGSMLRPPRTTRTTRISRALASSLVVLCATGAAAQQKPTIAQFMSPSSPLELTAA